MGGGHHRCLADHCCGAPNAEIHRGNLDLPYRAPGNRIRFDADARVMDTDTRLQWSRNTTPTTDCFLPPRPGGKKGQCRQHDRCREASHRLSHLTRAATTPYHRLQGQLASTSARTYNLGFLGTNREASL